MAHKMEEERLYDQHGYFHFRKTKERESFFPEKSPCLQMPLVPGGPLGSISLLPGRSRLCCQAKGQNTSIVCTAGNLLQFQQSRVSHQHSCMSANHKGGQGKLQFAPMGLTVVSSSSEFLQCKRQLSLSTLGFVLAGHRMLESVQIYR